MYVPKRVRVNTILDWKGHGELLPMTVMTIRYYDFTRAVPPVPAMNVKSYGLTRAVLIPIYDLTVVLG